MGKNEERRRQLKAAERRRSRRPQPSPPSDANVPSAAASAARRLDDAILSAIVHIDREHSGLVDRDLRAALQGALRGAAPTIATAQPIYQALVAVQQSQQPTARLWRDALNQMLQTANAYDVHDMGGRNCLQFLQSVAS